MKAVIFAVVLLMSAVVYADVSIHPTSRITSTVQDMTEIKDPKAVSELTIRVIQSGYLSVSGNINRANMTLYIPQENIENINIISQHPDGIEAGSWRYIFDEFGNRKVLFEWENVNSDIEYRVETIIRNTAKHLYREKGIGTDSRFLGETDSIVFSESIKESAFPFEKTMKRVAELTRYVNELMDYDISLVGERKSSVWALQNKRGVCVEHANLLTALLRISDMPARYVVGYAYSTVDKKLIGHTWVEVLADDGTWVSFDPTWLQAGYLDATHIVTGRLLDDEQKDTLTYAGTGNIQWTRNDDRFEIIDFKEEGITDITARSENFAINSYGYIKAVVGADECTILDISIDSCVDSSGRPLFDIKDRERKVFTCGQEEMYWLFSSEGLRSDRIYTCPVTVYDNSGKLAKVDVKLSGTKSPPKVIITGPDTVSVNEIFTLNAVTDSSDFLFFSPSTQRYSSRNVTLSIDRPGTHTFYLFSGGAAAEKSINVVRKKEFSIITKAPSSVPLNSSFLVVVEVKNLEDTEESAVIRVEFDGTVKEAEETFLPGEEKRMNFTMAPRSSGIKSVIASALSDSISSYSSFIVVEKDASPTQDIAEKGRNILDRIFSALGNLIKGLIGMLEGIFSAQ